MNEKLNNQPKNNQKKLFAIKYHSEMTDASHYFVHPNFLILGTNKEIKELIDTDDANRRIELFDLLYNKGFKYYTDENSSIDDDIINNLIVIREYSYRF